MWDVKSSAWEEGFARLQAYTAEHQTALVPVGHLDHDDFPLGRWVVNQRQNYKRGRLSADRQARLAHQPGWAWDVNSSEWEENFTRLFAYAVEHGHARVPDKHVTADGFRLGGWVSGQRRARKRGKLSAEREARLAGLPGWVWVVRGGS